MANTYNWKINQLDAKIHENDLDNVIYTVHYRFYAEDNSDPKIIQDIIGCINVVYDPENAFIPYEDLTKQDVVGWLESELDVPNMKEMLDEKINLIKNPVNEYLNPNWD
jgi:hypothetical protein